MNKSKHFLLAACCCLLMTGMISCDNEDKSGNIEVPQENIADFIDVAKLADIKDWHLVEQPLSDGSESLTLAELPDWLPYANTYFLFGIGYSVATGTWNGETIYRCSNAFMSWTGLYYDAEGNFMQEMDDVMIIEGQGWHQVARLRVEKEAFDATALFGQRIESGLVGIWKQQEKTYMRCYEFRANGSGRLWNEGDDGTAYDESRFLYTILDVQLSGVAKDWTVVKFAFEEAETTEYNTFILKDGLLYEALSLSKYAKYQPRYYSRY